ncbi:MAG: DUF433 domain-containing protein [Actinomycetes bacterium]
MSYDPTLAAALSGVTIAQLRYWRRRHADKPALLTPEFSYNNRVCYSFRDVIALRTVAYLREESSLQKVRRALSTLKSLGADSHLSEYKLVSTGNTIALLDHEDAVDLVARPGQHLIAEMVDVLAPFTNIRGDEVPDFQRPRKNLVVDSETLSGFPVILGTRVPYDVVAELVDDGVPPEEIKKYYPTVSVTAARDAQDYANYVRRVAA